VPPARAIFNSIQQKFKNCRRYAVTP
jgi:hypothetical protein